jgi:hypothetical protein
MANAKGLWIPIDILQRRDLQQYDKIVYALICYLSQYGGLMHDHMEQWAANLGCDRGWLEYELQRLAKKYLIHREGMAWLNGPPNTDALQKLPELPPNIEPLSINNGIATVYDEKQKAVKFYRAPSNGEKHMSNTF